jgi:hypothetical protein
MRARTLWATFTPKIRNLTVGRTVFLLVFFLRSTSGLTLSQTGVSTGEIRGTVTDSSDGAIVSATISLVSRKTGQAQTFPTTDTGTYHALLLRPDIYEVRVEVQGFQTEYRSVEVTVGQTAVLDFRVKPASDATTLEVRFIPALSEPERTQQSNTITGDLLQHLPIDKRNYLTYSLMMPGIADADALADANDYRPPQVAHSGISFFGNNGRGNAVSVDGGEANDSGGGVRPTLSQDAVQEFQINRANYSVEFGGSSGGTINIVSRAGTNALHGSVFGFFKDQRLDAADSFATTLERGRPVRVKPASRRQQSGATFGGPVVKNRTFFFSAFEGLHRNESQSISVLTNESIFEPTTDQKAVLESLPSPTADSLREALTSSNTTRELFRANSGVFPYRSSEWKGSIRLDHAWTDSNQIMFRWNAARMDETNPNTRALLGASRAMQTHRLDHTAILGWTKIISARTVNQFHYQYNHGAYNVGSLEPFGPELNINGFGYFNRDAVLPSRMSWTRQQFAEKLNLSRGAHLLKIGGEFLSRENSVNAQTYFSGRFNFGTLPGIVLHPALGSVALNAVQAFNLGIPQSYQQAFGDPTVASTEPYVAGYFEDRWHVLRNVTLEWGIRYEVDDLRDPVRTDPNNFAPRIGFAWDVRANHRTTVRGGFGVFYAPSNYALVHVANALGETDGKRQIAQVLTSIGTPGPASAPNIYRTLLAQSVITRPMPTRQIQSADLEQFGIDVRLDQRPPLSVRFSTAPDYASAYTEQTSMGIQHAVGSSFVVSANYLFVSGLRILRARDQNLLPVPANPELGIRVWSLASRDPSLFRDVSLVQDNVYESTGRSFYHGMTLEVAKQFSKRIGLHANYTWSKAIDDVVDFNSDFQAADQLDLRAERALSSFDQRHKVVGYASIETTSGWMLSPILRANSGRPFNLLVGSDLNEDFHATTDRPPFAGRNTGRGPAFWSVDLRLTRGLRIGEAVKLDVLGEAFNVFNRLNFRSVNNAVGMLAASFNVRGRRDVGPSEPLGFTSAFEPRQIQIGMRLSF